MKKFLLLLLFALTAFLPIEQVRAEGVVDKEVEVVGNGMTREDAVNDGLAQALGQVLGLSMSSRSAAIRELNIHASEKTDVKDSSREEKVRLQDRTRRAVDSQVNGNIKSYRVLSENVSALGDGSIDVRMSVVVSRYEASPQTQRKRMAVLPFRPLRGTDMEKLLLVELAQSLTDFFTQTRNFAVLERQYLAEKHSEFDLLSGSDVPPAERARIGNTLGTDYMLVGSVTAFQLITGSKKIPYTNETKNVITGNLSLNWRLLNAPTGQIMASGVHTELLPDFPLTSNKEDSRSLVARLAHPAGEKIARKITDIIYPLAPIAFRNGILTIARGGDSMRVGQKYQLIKYGEVMMDPYTKEALAREEHPVGTVEITDVAPKLSHAKILDCSVDLQGLQPREYILRPLAQPKPVKKAPATMTPNW